MPSNIASVFVPGPAFIYTCQAPASVGTPAGSSYSYLGQTEGDLSVTEQMAEEDVHIDQTGPRVPFDVQFMGKEAFVQGTLIRFDETVWERFAARLSDVGGTTTINGVSGNTFMAIGDAQIGTLMRTERKFFWVAISCPYATKTAFTDHPTGYTFRCGWLHAAYNMTLSTQKKRMRIAMRFLPDWSLSSAGSAYGVIATLGLPASLPAIT